MDFARRSSRIAAFSVLAALFAPALAFAQQGSPVAGSGHDEPSSIALPLPEDIGAAGLEESLRRLSSTASLMMIVAHPDDEDGALLTYLSRGLGVRCTLLTLTRGEGGQNAMSSETYDALGLIRTNELLKASEYYGAKQLWGTEADFGFSKTQEEAFARWGHDRVLYDAVLAVRQERPEVIVSTFVGGVTDGHGHHQVSGEIAQEVFKAAADPKVFPEQLKDGLAPWQPLAVYSMVPFAPVTDKGMFDYATGKWAPAKFKNYVTGEWTTGVLSADVTIQVGRRDPVLGRSYTQIAREGWGMQKSQYGGAVPALSGPAQTRYHLWAVAPGAAAKVGAIATNTDLFHNSRVDIDTGIGGLSGVEGVHTSKQILDSLHQLGAEFKQFSAERGGLAGVDAAHKLTPIYRQTLELRKTVEGSDLDAEAKASMLFELDAKISEFQSALANLLGLDLMAYTTKSTSASDGGGPRGSAADETPRSVSPGADVNVRIHTAHASPEAELEKTWLEKTWLEKTWTASAAGGALGADEAASTAKTGTTNDAVYRLHVPADAQPTAPYFTRPNIEQAYYDVSQPQDRLRSFAPWPLSAWAEFRFDGLSIRLGKVVQTMQRVLGPGGVFEPLVVTPLIGVRMEPEARIIPLDGTGLGGRALPVRVTVHAQAAAEGTIELKLPAQWTAEPASAPFHLSGAGDTAPIEFKVTPHGEDPAGGSKPYAIQAVVQSGGQSYQTGWRAVGYAGMRPYNLYRPAQMLTRAVNVKVAAGLRVGYLMGTGDEVPGAIEALGVTPHILTKAEIVSGDFSTWNVLVVGIRAYSALPELAAAQPRLNDFVRKGGTLIVEYQGADFPAPVPLRLGGSPEKVVDEMAPVKLLDVSNPVLTTPNAITPADFDGWVEERGHSFLESWDPAYTALTETADPGQDPQRGGLVVAHPGKGTYIYVAYALYRQLPELVPGSYRILANLLSATGR